MTKYTLITQKGQIICGDEHKDDYKPIVVNIPNNQDKTAIRVKCIAYYDELDIKRDMIPPTSGTIIQKR